MTPNSAHRTELKYERTVRSQRKRSNRARLSPTANASVRSIAHRPRPHTEVGLTLEQADQATGLILEVIDDVVLALGYAVHAILYYRPAKGAEQHLASQKLGLVSERLVRALKRID